MRWPPWKRHLLNREPPRSRYRSPESRTRGQERTAEQSVKLLKTVYLNSIHLQQFHWRGRVSKTSEPHQNLGSYLRYVQGEGCSWTVQKAQKWLYNRLQAPLTWPGELMRRLYTRGVSAGYGSTAALTGGGLVPLNDEMPAVFISVSIKTQTVWSWVVLRPSAVQEMRLYTKIRGQGRRGLYVWQKKTKDMRSSHL